MDTPVTLETLILPKAVGAKNLTSHSMPNTLSQHICNVNCVNLGDSVKAVFDMSVIFVVAVIGALTLAPTHSRAQADCVSTYGASCPSCAGVRGRSYITVAPFGCTVCWGFCKINLPRETALPSNEGALEGQSVLKSELQEPGLFLPYEERLFLRIKAPLVTTLAPTSPDIALAAKNLAELSARLESPMTSHGQTVSPKLVTPSAVAASVGGNGSATIALLLRELPSSETVSMVTWELRKLKKTTGKAQLVFRHKIFNETEKTSEQIQPDILFELVWRKTGDSGYWDATAWRILLES
jgi:hypothetical protein